MAILAEKWHKKVINLLITLTIFFFFSDCHLAPGDQQCWSRCCSWADCAGRTEPGDTHVASAAKHPHHRVRDPATGRPRIHPEQMNLTALSTNRKMADWISRVDKASYLGHPGFANKSGILRSPPQPWRCQDTGSWYVICSGITAPPAAAFPRAPVEPSAPVPVAVIFLRLHLLLLRWATLLLSSLSVFSAPVRAVWNSLFLY